MASAATTDKITVSVWTTAVDADVVEEIAYEKTGLNRDIIRELSAQGNTKELSPDKIDEYIAAEREIYKRLQAQGHKELIDDYVFLKSATASDASYVCSYAPMMIVELTSDQIQTLSKVASVEVLTYAPVISIEEDSDVSLNLIRATDVRDDETHPHKGVGVRIGQLEYGIPDVSAFPDQSVEVNTAGTCIVREHATAVAEIMISNAGYKGVAPMASLYCTGSNRSATSFYQGVEWLISKNVNVINMSAGIAGISNSGEYTYIEKWLDHIAINHSVHFVKSAGNTGNYVSAPGLAYNIITVGNLNDNNSDQYSISQVLRSSSAYMEATTNSNCIPTNKPELVAPGTNITTNSLSSFSGTSAAAPHVTGVIAQLLEQYPALKTQQDTVKAILTASVRHTYRQYDSDDNDFDKYGAGLIDAKSSSNTIKLGRFISDSFSAGTHDTYETYEFDVTNADEIIRVSLTWLKYHRFASGNSHEGDISGSSNNTLTDLVDLDLAIIAPDGTELVIGAFINYNDNNNLVIAQFDPEVYGYGTYKIQVWIRDASDSRTYYSIAWW